MKSNYGAVAIVDDDLPHGPTSFPKRKKDEDRIQQRPVDDIITKMLKAEGQGYMHRYKFDWAKEPIKRFGGNIEQGYMFTFSRWYFGKNVIVDIVPVDNDKERLVIAQKREAIMKYNQTKPKAEKIGYLPVFGNQTVTRAVFDAVLDKRVYDLPPRPDHFETVYDKEVGLVRTYG